MIGLKLSQADETVGLQGSQSRFQGFRDEGLGCQGLDS